MAMYPRADARGDAVLSDEPLDVEAALEGLAGDVRAAIVAWLDNPRQAARGRCALHAFRAAAGAGYTVERLVARGLFEVCGPGGTAVLAPLAFETRSHEAGAVQAQARLRDALEGAISDHRYVLHIRQPLDEDFEPEMVVQAVTVWQHAVRRGEYVGSDAVYQDDGVHIEFTLTDLPRADRSLLLQANPTPGLERMGVVGAILLRLAALHEGSDSDGPLIPCLAAEPAWRLTRGHAEQVLFGTASETVVTCGSEASYTSIFDASGALLGEDGAARVGAVWWLEPGANGGCAGWAHENPWCTSRDRVPTFPGRRFAVMADLPNGRYRLGWTSR